MEKENVHPSIFYSNFKKNVLRGKEYLSVQTLEFLNGLNHKISFFF